MNRPRRAWGPTIGRYTAAVVEQGLWSLLNLGVNLGVARFVSPEGYGAFVFWANLGFVLSSLQAALTICHLQVLAPGDGMAPHRLATERLMHGVTAIFLVAVGVAVLIGERLWGGLFAMSAACIFLPSYLFQQYLRSLYFSRGKPWIAAAQTGSVLVLAAAFLGFAVAQRRALEANVALLCLASAYGLVGVFGAIAACRRQLPGLRLADLRGYSAFAMQSGWVFLGVSTTELLARFYAFIVAAWYGPRQLAILAATQLLMRPVPLLASSWGMVARADLNRQRDAGAWDRFNGLLLVALGGGAVIAVTWTSLVTLGWPQIADHLFSGKYREFTYMVALWGLSSALNFGQVVLNTGLQVLRAFKNLALANAVASLTAALAIIVIMWKFGYVGAIAGTAAGQALEIVVMALLLAATVRKLRAAP
jgi:O-antigen/teichoic acid export membrane protein